MSSIHFDLFIGIDYSGAQTPIARLSGLQVYAARAGEAATKWMSPASSNSARPLNWTRREVAHMLLERARSSERFLAGLDHCFSMPWSYFERFDLDSWPAFLDDFVAHWPTHHDDVSVDSIRRHERHNDASRAIPLARSGGTSELRIAERWTASAKSVFQFDMQGSVAKSSHAGIPWLKWLRDQAGDRLHFWPFDGWQPAPGKSVLVEIYPSIFRNRYPREGRSVDEQDAFACAQWMADMAARGALAEYFDPPLSEREREVAACEGWVLGIR
ncbi:MAG TPA: hypothetical protein VFB54_16005 [Burkholderiales bacterium]|nr:hypothetical protein [Burkholderiales bacterium]